MGGYDVIGDVHGCAAALRGLLDGMGYRDSDGTYGHDSRQAVFVGDLVDRGAGQLEVLQIVKRMVDRGSAQIVMGNHEFNAVAFDTEDPNQPGEYLRPRIEKNRNQHREFLEQVTGDERRQYLDWFLTMPLWLDLGGLRVVHACWHEPSMRAVEEALGGNHFTSRDQFVRATDKGDSLYEAIEVLLKGPEIKLTGLPPYHDKDGHARTSARAAWWRPEATTLRELAVMADNYTTADGAPYPPLPDVEVSAAQDYWYDGEVPVVYGHYWRTWEPTPGVDYTDRTACVDFSAIKGGPLVAYRWDGEATIDPQKYYSFE